MAGGHSDARKVDEEHRTKFSGWKGSVEDKAGRTFAIFEPVSYTQQVVAGMIYHVKYKVADGEWIHARVYQPLPHTGEPAQCQVVAGGKGETDPIEILNPE